MGARYVPISLAQMDEVLVERCGFKRVPKPGIMEHVYERVVTRKSDGKVYPMRVRVFSSVHVNTGVTRDCGEDAIRIQLISDALAPDLAQRFSDGMPVSKKKHAKAKQTIHRTKNALPNLYEGCRKMFALAFQIACPACGGPLMPRESAKGPFYGCGNYPICRGSATVAEVETTPGF